MKQQSTIRSIADAFQSAVASKWFWRASVWLFSAQAVYLAFVGRFSMAFDEHFHLAAIQQYAHVIFPWSVTQPPGPAVLSAFTVDGSYLYHYLMSWPYRLIALVTDSQTAQIITFRLLDVGIVVAGLYIFRRLLLELKVPRVAAHYIMAIIMLMPMASFMTGQLTYDSLFFTFGGLTMLALVRLTRSLAEHHTLPLAQTAWAGSLILLTSQVKYAFLPAALGATVYLFGLLVYMLRTRKTSISTLWRSWRHDIRLGASMVAVGMLLLSGVLFMQRYGMNYVRYGSVVPNCAVVLSEKRCQAFAPYGRDATLHSYGMYKKLTFTDKLSYPASWYKKMIRESYFSVGPREIGYKSLPPLPSQFIVGNVLAAFLLLVIVLRLPWILRSSTTAQLAFAVVFGYVAALFAKNFSAYVFTGIPLSIHGRYMLPFLPLVGYLAYVGVRPLVQRYRLQLSTTVLAALLLIGSFYGGGLAVLILGSTDTWFWPDAAPMSHAVRSMLAPFIIH